MNGQSRTLLAVANGFDRISSVEKGELTKRAIITFDKPYYHGSDDCSTSTAADPKVFAKDGVNNWRCEGGAAVACRRQGQRN